MRITLEVTKRRLLGVALVGAALAAAVWGGTAVASSPSTNLTVCVKSSGKITASTSGSCGAHETQYVLATQTELDALSSRVTTLETDVSNLQTLLSGVTRTKFDGADTLRFSGMNVQITDASGSSQCADPGNGLGNLIVGYDLGATDTSGCDNIVVGEGNNFTSVGGFVAGAYNTIGQIYASVSGGDNNTASGNFASVSGGGDNTASGVEASISGGSGNTATGVDASVSGGAGNTAYLGSVSGGEYNNASALYSSISGGFRNTATLEGDSLSGGESNTADGPWSSILGGSGVTTSSRDEVAP